MLIIGAGFLAYRYDPQFAAGANKYLYRSLCDTPITYSLGNIDKRFGMTNQEVLSDAQTATRIWGVYEGKNLVQYDPASTFKINMVYDERQQLSTQLGNLQDQLNTQKNSLDPQIAAYEKLKTDFQNKLNAYQDEVRKWNSEGGAPQDVYDRLLQEKSDLQKQADNLNAQAKSLNQDTQDYNSVVNQLNGTVGKLDRTLAQKPEEGLYDPKNDAIDIYFNTNKDELIHTLAHEMGHALGLGHVDNPDAIMYKFSSASVTLSGEDQNALSTLCQKHSFWDIAYGNLQTIATVVMTKIQKMAITIK